MGEYTGLAGSEGLPDSNIPGSDLREAVASCSVCALRGTCRAPVPYGGDLGALLGVYGEAPGATEDEEGAPFRGASGVLLDRVLLSLGWSRDRCFVSNIVKCRPPGNKKPERAYKESCRPHLVRELRSGRFRVLLALGDTAISALTGERGAVSAFLPREDLACALGGRTLPVVACYHPAYILRKRSEGADAYRAAMLSFAAQVRRAVVLASQDDAHVSDGESQVGPQGQQVLPQP